MLSLERLILVLLVAIGLLLGVEAFIPFHAGGLFATEPLRVSGAAAFGVAIGVVSSLLGVAGGELIIPTLVLAFGFDIKLAGTASVIVSLPTVWVGCWRYRQGGELSERADFWALILL